LLGLDSVGMSLRRCSDHGGRGFHSDCIDCSRIKEPAGKVTEWVSVSDRLPPYQSALFWGPLTGLCVVGFVGVREWPELISDEGYTHWAPLPPPPTNKSD